MDMSTNPVTSILDLTQSDSLRFEFSSNLPAIFRSDNPADVSSIIASESGIVSLARVSYDTTPRIVSLSGGNIIRSVGSLGAIGMTQLEYGKDPLTSRFAYVGKPSSTD